MRHELGKSTASDALASVVAIVPETGADVAMAVRAGARGVVFEDRLGEALVPTVGAVRAGQLAVPRRFHRHAVKPETLLP